MKVFIAADHNGFTLKEFLIKFLQEKGYEVEDCGNSEHDPSDDYPDYVSRLAESFQKSSEESRGIVICGSGIGVDLAVNKYPGLLCGLGFDADQVKAARADDGINVLALAAKYLSLEKARDIVISFLETPIDNSERHVRRRKKVSEIGNS